MQSKPEIKLEVGKNYRLAGIDYAYAEVSYYDEKDKLFFATHRVLPGQKMELEDGTWIDATPHTLILNWYDYNWAGYWYLPDGRVGGNMPEYDIVEEIDAVCRDGWEKLEKK